MATLVGTPSSASSFGGGTGAPGNNVVVTRTGVLKDSALWVVTSWDPITAGAVPSSVSDNLVGTYSAGILDSVIDTTNNQNLAQSYFAGHPSGDTTITINFSGTVDVLGVLVFEVAGIRTQGAYGGSAGVRQATPTTVPNLVQAGPFKTLGRPGILLALSGDMTVQSPPAASVAALGWTDAGTFLDLGLGGANFFRAASKPVLDASQSLATFTALNNRSHSTIAMVLLDAGGAYGRPAPGLI